MAATARGDWWVRFTATFAGAFFGSSLAVLLPLAYVEVKQRAREAEFRRAVDGWLRKGLNGE